MNYAKYRVGKDYSGKMIDNTLLAHKFTFVEIVLHGRCTPKTSSSLHALYGTNT